MPLILAKYRVLFDSVVDVIDKLNSSTELAFIVNGVENNAPIDI